MQHTELYEIIGCVHSLGFSWNMTTHATLIDETRTSKLKLTGIGMYTVSVSIDGMVLAQDSLRRQICALWRGFYGLRLLQNAVLEPQVTTVFYQENYKGLEHLCDLLCEIEVTSWRPINVELIRRACESNSLLLAAFIKYIRNKRFDQNCVMEVTFGCSHFLGVEQKRMVRDRYFFCGAVILISSVRCNGDICVCLDIELSSC